MAAQRQSRIELQRRVAALEKELLKKDKRIADADRIVRILSEGLDDKREEISRLEEQVEDLEAREEERAARGCAGCTMQDVIINGHTTRYVWHDHGPNAGGAVVALQPQAQQVVINNYYPPVYVHAPVGRPQMRKCCSHASRRNC